MFVRGKRCCIWEKAFLFFNLVSISFAVVSVSIGFVVYVLNSEPLRQHNTDAFVSNICDFPFFCLVVSFLHYSIIYGFSLGNRLRFVFPVSVKRRLWTLLIVSLIWMAILKSFSGTFQVLHSIPSPLIWLSEVYIFIPFLFPWRFFWKQQYKIMTICRIWLFVQLALSIAFLTIYWHKKQLELDYKSICGKAEEKTSIPVPHHAILSQPLSKDLSLAPVAATIPEEAVCELAEHPSANASVQERSQAASNKNQLMDELLDLPVIPADYGATMVALYRDRTQDDITRDFAVQHIGLYAQALNRSGAYAPDSEDACLCRNALLDAADETRTIIAAAAFRALADISAFDPHIDDKRLDAMLVSCVGDSFASPAARVMAAQLCGERGMASSRIALERLLDNPDTPAPLRHSAKWTLEQLANTNR
jgi:hypothetical protein